MNFFDRYQSWLHIIGWVIFISLPFLTLPSFIWNRQDLISIGLAQLLTGTLTITFFYINLRSLTPVLLKEHNTQRFFLTLGAMLVSVVAVKLSCYYLFPPAMHLRTPPGPLPGIGRPPGPPRPFNPWPGTVSTGLSFGFAIIVSSLIALFRHHTRSQAIQQQMVLEKVSAELAMLKLQVSPHFLFNTLNNIRWLARRKSDQTEEAVVTLAQLLWYMIYQAQQDKVSLRQEVEHLQHYIDLQKIRLTNLHTVSFRYEGNIDAHQIEPLLFIPFVENAFKYGLHSHKPAHISIYLSVTDKTLTFYTQNPIYDSSSLADAYATNKAANSDSGIGIVNVRKRLLLHYPDRHELEITTQNNEFSIVLTLHLHHEEVALHRH